MFREHCEVLENKKVAPGHFVLKMRSPRIARNARPGQFVQILCADSFDPLLPRPFSFLTTDKKDFDILYHVIGKGTQLLALAKKGDAFWVLGPLGNGFDFRARGNNAVLVGGGVGIPPLYHLAQHLHGNNVHVFLGARNKTLLLCEKDFRKLGVELAVSTDDGSKGKKGFVTGLVEDFLNGNNPKGLRIYTCGPTPMLKAVSFLAQKFGVPCEVSVEVPMACGFGACLGCAIKVKERFAIACCEGPVFQGSDIAWD